LENPANASGTINSVEVYAESNLSNFVVATFFLISGSTYECRDSQSIGSVTSGSKQTFEVDLDVEAGDFIGGYWTSGDMERDTSGYAGIMDKPGDYTTPTDQIEYHLWTGDAISIYGTGVG
jgi:hypothetical protein